MLGLRRRREPRADVGNWHKAMPQSPGSRTFQRQRAVSLHRDLAGYTGRSRCRREAGQAGIEQGTGQRVKSTHVRKQASRSGLASLLALGLFLTWIAGPIAQGQAPPATQPSMPIRPGATPELAGRIVEDVRIIGNSTVSNALIRNLIRTQIGDRFDPATVQEDYQRIYDLKKFKNVEARVE